MFRVLSCLAVEHDLRLVAVAGLVCFLASLSAISLFNRARATAGSARVSWIAAAGVATGAGIWATHFIAMLAYEPGIPIAYDIWLTSASLAAAVAVTACGLAVATYGTSAFRVAGAGAIVGAGVATMHYLGMWAVELPGRITWAPDLVAASIVIGMALGAAGLSLAVRREDMRTMLAAATTLTLAIVLHHFTAMGAVEIIPDPTRAVQAFSLSPASLALAIAGAAVGVLGVSIIGALSDHRLAARSDQFSRVKQKLIRDSEAALSAQNLKLDAALNNMSQALLVFDAEGRLTVCNDRYFEMYDLSRDVVKPGCTLRELIEHRKSVGLVSGDAAEYCRMVLEKVHNGETWTRVFELADGRSVQIVNRPMPGGGWVTTHEDITERKQAQARIAQETNQNKRLFETSLDLILVTDRQGTMVRVSPSAATILGYPPEEMVGRSAAAFVYPDDLAATRTEMKAARKGRHMRNFETRYVHKDGRVITLVWSGVWSDAEQMHFFTGRDISERKVAENRLNYLAHYDQLTGLPNRASLQEDMDALIQASLGHDGRPSALAVFDLDGFKDVNDTLGHSVGDELLQQVARRMSGAVSGHARFYRLGGDEFVLTVPDCGDPRDIVQLTRAVLDRLGEAFDIKGHRIFIGASSGIAMAPSDGATAEELISNADLALYDAKSAGGHVYRLFLPVMRARAQARRELDSELRRACAEGEFVLYFQPQLRLSDGALVGAEALLRWQHPTRGILAAGAFIDALIESPVVLEVGRWVLQTACETAAAWRRRGLPDLRIGVNLFPAQFQRAMLLEDVDAALRTSGLPPELLEIEITENIALAQDDASLEPLRKLRASGVHLAFDDFGTGYASLSYLARYPLSRIKIDQSFVRKIADNPSKEDTAIIRSIIVMAHNLGLEIIAEGVETAAQAAFLRGEKCEEAQGFLYSKPVPALEFERFAQANRNDAGAAPTQAAGG